MENQVFTVNNESKQSGKTTILQACMQHLIAYLHICEENMLYPNAIDSIHGKLKLSQDKTDLYATMLKISNNPEKYTKDGALILYQMIPDIEAKTVKEVLEFLEGEE